MGPRPRRWAWPAAFAACWILAGWRSLSLGKDANWDLRNYHWYNVWALFHGRLGFDLAPAQLQTWHNPTADIPFYFLVQWLPWPRHVAFWMALSTAIAGWFLLRTLVLLFPAGRWQGRPLWIAIAAAVGMTGAAGWATTGSTMNEWPSAALVMAGLFYAVRAVVQGEARQPRGLLLGAFLAGCAVGLKLTYAVFGVGFLAALAAWGTPRERLRRVLGGGVAMAAGVLLFHGWWGAVLWREYGNPFFPYFNAIFQSPWWEPVNFFDRNFGPRSLREWLFFPVYFSHRSTLVSEVGFRDYRLAVLLVLALCALAKHRILGIAGARPPAVAPDPVDLGWRFLGVFTLASYLAWLKLYGIYRYLVPLEVVSGALIVACLLYLLRGNGWRYAAAIVLGALLLGTTRKGDWGRVPFGHSYFDVAAPELPPDALVIVGFAHPLSYAIPFFRPDARWVAPASNFLALGQRNLLARRIAEVVRGHAGPIYLLEYKVRERQDLATLAHFGLAADDASCRPVRSAMSYDYLRICRVERRAKAG